MKMKSRAEYLREKIEYYKKCIDVAEDMAWKDGVTEEASKELFLFVKKRLRNIEIMEQELKKLEGGK